MQVQTSVTGSWVSTEREFNPPGDYVVMDMDHNYCLCGCVISAEGQSCQHGVSSPYF